MIDSRAQLLSHVTEAAWQKQVITWAHRGGYLVSHVHDSRKQEWGTDSGVPDLLLARAGSPLLLPELKTQHGRVSTAQWAWLDVLGQVTSVEAPIWRPGDEELVRRTLEV